MLATTASADARLLPAGPLREPRSSLARARAVLAIGGAPPPSDAPSFRGALRPTALVRAVGDDWRVEPLDAVRGVRVLAVAGVARPERFFATLAGAGATVAATVAFADHHAYAAADAVRLAAEAAGLPIVTTEKDLVKLARFPALRDVRALRVELEVEDGERLLEVLTR